MKPSHFRAKPYEYNGITYLIRDDASTGSEMDIIAEVQANYEWDFPIRAAIDLGGHIGSWSRWAKHLNPEAHIVAVEIEDVSYRLLEANLNGLRGVKPVNRRIGYVPGPYKIMYLPRNSGSTYTYPITEDEMKYPFYRCPENVSVEQLIDYMGFERVDVMKMDIEGAEVEVLNHISDEALGKIQRIVGEIHCEPRQFVAQTKNRLSVAGFQVYYKPHPGDYTLFYIHAWRED